MTGLLVTPSGIMVTPEEALIQPTGMYIGPAGTQVSLSLQMTFVRTFSRMTCVRLFDT